MQCPAVKSAPVSRLQGGIAPEPERQTPLGLAGVQETELKEYETTERMFLNSWSGCGTAVRCKEGMEYIDSPFPFELPGADSVFLTAS